MTQKSWLNRGKRRIAHGFDRILLYDFDALDEHRSFAESSLNAAITSLEKRVNREIAAMDPEEKDSYRDHMYDQYIATTEILPRIQWNSQFLVIYSTFEHMLNELCKIVQRRSHFELSFKDISGQGIERSKNYLSKVAGVKSPFQSPGWQRAKLLAEIRNAIAHKNGVIELNENDKSCLATRLADEPHVSLKKEIPDQDDAQILLSNEFIRDSIADLRNVLSSICNYELYND